MVSNKRVSEVLAFCNEYGDHETCNHFQISKDSLDRYKRLKNFNDTKQPKILILDIETAPMVGTFWRIGYKVSLTHENIMKDWFILSWAARWLFAPNTMGDVVTSEEALIGDDCRIMRSLWNLLEEADIVVAHNGSDFDIPKINTRFIMNDIMPPTPFMVLDTLKSARVHSFSSNKLDYLGELVRRKGKLKTEYKLWLQCLAGEQEALDYMLKYNKEDVVLLEEVYLWLRPFMKSHPNLAMIAEAKELTCHVCLSNKLVEAGPYYTSVNSYTIYRCTDCGALSRGRKSNISKDQSKNILQSTLRPI